MCRIKCGKCSNLLDLEKVVGNGYMKSDHCDFWNRIPKWKSRADEGDQVGHSPFHPFPSEIAVELVVILS